MSKLIKCIIVDDEPAAIRLLEKYVAKVSFLHLDNTFTKPLEALAYLEKNTIDLVFLDIQMPEITGIQLSKIMTRNTDVIFTTAYSEFALESYNVSAVDYLLKPIEFERFYKAVSKLQEVALRSSSDVRQNQKEDDFFFFKTDGKNKFAKVFLKDILFVEGLKNYVSVQLKNEQIITYNTLKNLRENLPETQFFQIHKSFIISLKHIDKIDNDSVWIGTRQLPIGNTYRKAFFNTIADNQI